MTRKDVRKIGKIRGVGVKIEEYQSEELEDWSVSKRDGNNKNKIGRMGKNHGNGTLQTSQSFLLQKMLQKILRMSHYVSIFCAQKSRENMRFVQNFSNPKNLEKSTGFLSIFLMVWISTMNISLYNLNCQKMMRKLGLLLRFFDMRNFE